MTTAHEILQAAQQHMKDRAKKYDNPKGERSMAATVAAFNAVTGSAMTEEQGYLLAAIAFSHGIDFKQKRARNFRNISGAIYGRLTAIGVHERDSSLTHWLCRCECGKYCRVSISNLNSGKQMSCGCLRDETRAQRAMESRKPEAEKRAKDLIRKARYNASRKGKQAQRRYYNSNRDKILEISRDAYKRDPESRMVYTRNRKARLRGADGSHTKEDIQLIGSEQGWKCTACDIDISNYYHVDHVIPISKGGSNWPSNIQLLCPSCNLRKFTKPLDVFLSEVWPDLYNSKEI